MPPPEPQRARAASAIPAVSAAPARVAWLPYSPPPAAATGGAAAAASASAADMRLRRDRRLARGPRKLADYNGGTIYAGWHPRGSLRDELTLFFHEPRAAVTDRLLLERCRWLVINDVEVLCVSGNALVVLCSSNAFDMRAYHSYNAARRFEISYDAEERGVMQFGVLLFRLDDLLAPAASTPLAFAVAGSKAKAGLVCGMAAAAGHLVLVRECPRQPGVRITLLETRHDAIRFVAEAAVETDQSGHVALSENGAQIVLVSRTNKLLSVSWDAVVALYGAHEARADACVRTAPSDDHEGPNGAFVGSASDVDRTRYCGCGGRCSCGHGARGADEPPLHADPVVGEIELDASPRSSRMIASGSGATDPTAAAAGITTAAAAVNDTAAASAASALPLPASPLASPRAVSPRAASPRAASPPVESSFNLFSKADRPVPHYMRAFDSAAVHPRELASCDVAQYSETDPDEGRDEQMLLEALESNLRSEAGTDTGAHTDSDHEQDRFLNADPVRWQYCGEPLDFVRSEHFQGDNVDHVPAFTRNYPIDPAKHVAYYDEVEDERDVPVIARSRFALLDNDVTCVDVDATGALIALGYRSGHVQLLDSQAYSVSLAKMKLLNSACTSIAFLPGEGKLAVAGEAAGELREFTWRTVAMVQYLSSMGRAGRQRRRLAIDAHRERIREGRAMRVVAAPAPGSAEHDAQPPDIRDIRDTRLSQHFAGTNSEGGALDSTSCENMNDTLTWTAILRDKYGLSVVDKMEAGSSQQQAHPAPQQEPDRQDRPSGHSRGPNAIPATQPPTGLHTPPRGLDTPSFPSIMHSVANILGQTRPLGPEHPSQGDEGWAAWAAWAAWARTAGVAAAPAPGPAPAPSSALRDHFESPAASQITPPPSVASGGFAWRSDAPTQQDPELTGLHTAMHAEMPRSSQHGIVSLSQNGQPQRRPRPEAPLPSAQTSSADPTRSRIPSVQGERPAQDGPQGRDPLSINEDLLHAAAPRSATPMQDPVHISRTPQTRTVPASSNSPPRGAFRDAFRPPNRPRAPQPIPASPPEEAHDSTEAAPDDAQDVPRAPPHEPEVRGFSTDAADTPADSGEPPLAASPRALEDVRWIRDNLRPLANGQCDVPSEYPVASNWSPDSEWMDTAHQTLSEQIARLMPSERRPPA